MKTRRFYIALLTVVVVSLGLAQTTSSEKPPLLRDRGLQLGLQLGGLIGDNEQPKEMKIIRMDNLFVQLFETFSPRAFLDYGLMNHVRGQFGASFGKIVGRHYSTSLIPIDYRFLIVPTYSRGFSPYLYAGVGGLHYDVTVGASRISPGVEKSGWALYVPGGIGFVSQLSPRLALDFNLGYNYIFSDDINGRRGKEEEKDSYYSGRFGIRIPLGKTGEDREDELLKKKLAEQEQQQKEAQMRLAEEKRQKELQERKAKEEQLKKEQEALEAQKAKEAEKLKEAEKAKEPQKPAEPAMPVVPKPEVAKAEMKF